jgi:glucose/arabinose dehydrogenase/mono/diheme cytochrome c family protein
VTERLNSKSTHCVFFLLSLAIFFSVFIACKSKHKEEAASGWVAPPEANTLVNPLQNIQVAQERGKALYNNYCVQCHGANGFGDGAAGNAGGQRPANFHDKRVRNQKQGAIFWKISNGKGIMPPFKDALTEEQRWQLVSYIRSFANTTNESKREPPKSLRPDITVSHVMTVSPLAVRLLQNPVSGEVYYTTFDGDIYHIKNLNGAEPTYEKILTVKDHGITRIQGAIFLKNTLFLCGNVDSTNKSVTMGRMVKYALGPKDTLRTTVVFNTSSYGSNKTIYDHGWNALALSPDGKYIYVNSGARTDHGEVQDDGGLFPNARDNALTAKIFRFPVDAKDLMLEDNLPNLRAAGYVYAEGIRNAYDMATDPEGNLFAVVNSSDYDNPEDMFWIREGHHYGFPWMMGGIENPQQYPDWQPSPETDKFINEFSHSWRVKYFHNDPDFPKPPAGLKFTTGVQNLGPDANEYRGHSGKVLDGDSTGVTVSTFTPHCSPLGLFFDLNHTLPGDLKGDGFVIRYSSGTHGGMMGAFTKEGSDMLHLQMAYDKAMDNYTVKTTRIIDGFVEPSDALLIGNDAYVIEYGGTGGNIWKIGFGKAIGYKNNNIVKKAK